MIDERTFVEEVGRAERTLYRVSRSLLKNEADCRDAMQEALLKAWQRRDSLRETAYFRTWLTRILINECRRMIRRSRRVTPVENLPERAAPPPDEALQDALDALEERLRLPLVLHYLEGFRVEEVARMLSIPSGTVKWRLSKARAALKAEWMEEEKEVRAHAAR